MSVAGQNIEFPIYYKDRNGHTRPFYDLVLHKATYESQVMSLGDKITGDVYYIDNNLPISMKEFIIYNDVKYSLVNPPTIVREGMVKDNSDLKGMTKYSFEFYHPMYMLLNFSFCDVAVTDAEKAYLSESKTFSWIGDARDFVAKLNKNLENTEWVVRISDNLYDGGVPKPAITKLSEVLSFDKNSIGDALKTFYETYDIPFIIDVLDEDDAEYPEKQYLILVGLPTSEVQGVKLEQDVVTTATLSASSTYYPTPYMLEEGDTITITKNVGASGKPMLLTSDLSILANGTYTATQQTEVFVGVSNASQPQSLHVVIEGEFIFKFGQGVGLKNNSRTPKNNKIITRLSGFGSEDNIPFGYPQIVWTGNPNWAFTYQTGGVHEITIDGETVQAQSYPIYKGVVGGQEVLLIKHPFTRNHLMPSSYADCVNRKVNPNATGYDPRIELIDYIDADRSYPNPINPTAPSYDIHEFEKIKPQLGEATIIKAEAWNVEGTDYVTISAWYSMLNGLIMNARNYNREGVELSFLESLQRHTSPNEHFYDGYSWGTHLEDGGYVADAVVRADNYFLKVDASSPWLVASNKKILYASAPPEAVWDDTMDDNGEYVQSYFKMTLPALGFDMYACASLTQEMNIVMRSGACIGCTFPVQVDWDDYKKNFYDQDGNFVPNGNQRDYNKYPNTTSQQVEIIVQKDLNTFGTLMPDIYRQPVAGDKFVITGISLPTTYITNAESELDDAMAEYMLENNVYYYDYPLKFDEHFLATHASIINKMRNNSLIKFQYGNEAPMGLYIKQMAIKYGDDVLPHYEITLTDDVEVTLNQIGQTTEDVSRLRVQMAELQKYYGNGVENGFISATLLQELSNKLSKVADDVARGKITFERGLQSLAPAFFNANIGSTGYVKGMEHGIGWNIDELGNAEFESVRIRSYLQVTQLLLNRIQAQEGDTVYSDNDEIDVVTPEYTSHQYPFQIGTHPAENGWCEKVIDQETGEETYVPTTDTTPNFSKTYYSLDSYILTFVAKWNGYFTSQMYGNILKGRINTLAAREMGVSGVSASDCVEQDGANKYFTSWMKVVDTRNTDDDLMNNQVRVVLYADIDTPAGKNFAPCPRMVVYRFGHITYTSADQAKYTAEGYSNHAYARRAIKTRQSVFSLSTTDGRIQKLIGVSQPKLNSTNYGVTIGVVPDFLYDDPQIEERLIEGADYLYAQGVVVGDFIKCDSRGVPLTTYYDAGEWNSSALYVANDWSDANLQYQTDEVWHNGKKWRCVMTNRNHEPTESATTYWELLVTNGADGITQQLIYKASNSEPAVPATTQSDSAPSGWSVSPQSVSSSVKNCWVCSRTKEDGVWSAFSAVSLYSHYAEDGTSFMVKGTAIAVVHSGGTIPTATQANDVYLNDEQLSQGNGYDIYTWNGTTWIGSTVSVGDAYICEGDLWVNQANTFWNNAGRIKGDDGENSVHAFLDNENDTMLYSSGSTTPVSGNITSTAYLYDGSTDKTSNTTWSIDAPSGQTAKHNCTASISGNVVTVTKMSNAQGHVYVRGTYGGNYYYVKLTLKRIVDADKYDIVCTPTAIAYNTTENEPTTASVTISCYKTDVTGTRTAAPPPSGYYLALVGVANDGTSQVSLGYVQQNSSLTVQNIALSSYSCMRAFVADSPVLVANDNFSAASDFHDHQTISINKSANGTSAWIADLTNEMDGVACDNNGNVLVLNPLQSVSTTVSLWYGATSKGFTIAMKKGNTAYSQSGATVGYVTATWNNTSGVITLTYNSGATISTSDVYEITLTSTDDNTISRVLKLTVSGVRAGEDGSFEIYQLHPTLDAVSVTPSGVPSREGFITNLTKRTQDGITDVYRNSLPSGFEIRYTINVDTQTKASQLLYAASGSSACQEMWYDFDDNQFVTTEPINGTKIVSNTNTNGAISVRGVLSVPSSVTYMVFYLWNGNTLLDFANIPFTKDGKDGDNGASAWAADLTNEMDAVSCDEGNRIIAQQTLNTTAKLYYGATEISSTISIKNKNGTTMTSGTAVAGVTATWDNSTGAITFTYSTNAVVPDKDTYTITISSTGASPISRELVFTVKGVVGDVYNLDPSLDKLVFSANAAGDALTPSSLSVYCSNTKRNLDGSVTLNIGTNRNNLWKNGGARYNTMYRYITGSTIGSWLWCKDLTNGTLTINSSDSYTGIEFCLTDANDRPEITDANIIDREVVPIIKHGLKGDTGDTGKGIQSTVIRYAVSATSGTTPPSSGWQASIPSINEGEYLWTRTTITYTDNTTSVSYSVTKYGESAASYDVIVDSSHIIVDAMGNLTANLEAHVLKAFRGSVTTDTTANALSLTFNNTNVSWTTQSSGTYTLANYTNTWSTLGNPTNALLAFRVNNVVVASASVPITLTGKMGRNLFYAGDYDELVRAGDTFDVTDFQAPYVSYVQSGQTRYKVWTGDNITNASYSSYPMSNANWTAMTNDFKYLISEAVFSDYAKLGSAIFNKDYMFSQWGTANGQQTSNYANTNPYFFESDTYVALNGTLLVQGDDTAYDNMLVIGNLYVQQGHTYTLRAKGTTTGGTTYVRFFNTTNLWLTNPNDCAITTSSTSSSVAWQANYTGVVSIGAYQTNSYTGTLTYVTVTDGTWSAGFKPNLAIDLFKGNIRAYDGFFKNVSIEGVLNNLITTLYDTSVTNRSEQLIAENATFQNAYNPESGDNYSLDVLRVGDVVRITSCRESVFLPFFIQRRDTATTYYCRTYTKYGGEIHAMTSDELYQLVGRRMTIFISSSPSANYLYYPSISGHGDYCSAIPSDTVYDIATTAASAIQLVGVPVNQNMIVDVEYVCADCMLVSGGNSYNARGIFPIVSTESMVLSQLDNEWT